MDIKVNKEEFTGAVTCIGDFLDKEQSEVLVIQQIPYTDFGNDSPVIDEAELWCCNGVIYLPSEE